MNPHDLLASDHQILRKHAGTLRDAIEKDAKQLARELLSFQKAAQKHFRREQFYLAILDDGKRMEDRDLIHQLRNDHAAVVFTLQSLVIRLRKGGVNPDWRGRFDHLMTVFLSHLDLEEKSLFPLGRKTLSAQSLETLTQQIESCE